jgi:hypothetical protein
MVRSGNSAWLRLLAVAAAAALTQGCVMWPFGNAKKDVQSLIGGSDAWLRGAEVVAWQPDPNYKPQSYFVSHAASESEFRSWAASLQLQVDPAPAIPPNVFILPDKVTLKGWDPSAEAALDARGTRGRSALWSRWRAGHVSTVVAPEYD